MQQYDSEGSSSGPEGEEEFFEDEADALQQQNGSPAVAAGNGDHRDTAPEADGADPQFAEPSEGSQAPQPRQTAVIEQCVAWGGERRVRFQVTFACAGALPNWLAI